MSKKLEEMAKKLATETKSRKYADGLKDLSIEKGSKEEGALFPEFIASMLLGNSDVRQAKEFARHKGFKRAEKAFSASIDLANGSPFTPAVIQQEVVDALRPKSIVLSSGVGLLNAPNGHYTFNHINTPVIGASPVAFCADASDSTIEVDNTNLALKKLAIKVNVCEDIYNLSSVDIKNLVENQIIQGLATTLDSQLLRGTDSGNQLKGLADYADDNVGHSFARTQAGASSTLQEIEADLYQAMIVLSNKNIDLGSTVWYMNPRTKLKLQTYRDSNGIRAFESLDNGFLLGRPVFETNNIPNNLGVGTDESEVYLVSTGSIKVVQATNMINFDTFTKYQADVYTFRAVMYAQLGCLYRGQEVVRITAIDW